MYKKLLICASLLALGACGGGGGSSGSASTGGGGTGGGGTGIGADNQPFTITGQAVSAQFTTPGVSAFSGPQTLTVNGSADTTGDGPDQVDLITGGTTTTVTDAVEEDLNLNGRVLTETDADGTILVTTDVSDESSFEFTVFGGWTQGAGVDADPVPGQVVSFGVAGIPASTLPSGSATYSGNSVGLASDGTDILLTTSDVTVTTDFSAVTVTSSGTLSQNIGDDSDVDQPTESASMLDFTSSGTVSGTGYTATGGGMQVNGAFYGPNAEETGGVFQGAPGGVNYGGAFGAAR